MTLFILQNQHNQFLNKDGEWSANGDANQLFNSVHYDVALNQLIELNAKDPALRGAVVACDQDSKGRPVLSQLTRASANKDPDIWIDDANNPDVSQPALQQSTDASDDAGCEETEAGPEPYTEPESA